MNNKILAFLGTLFVTIVSVVFAYYLNLNKPDVRYTLSEEIPLSFSTMSPTGNENVQQLEVRNVGSARAEEIVVKISGNITNYKVINYISSDTVQAFIEQQPAEFVYPALPPQAGFKIIFISSNVVDPSDISASHSTGQAVNALSASNRSNSYIVGGIYILIFGGYLVWILISFRNFEFSSWISETKGKRIDQALKTSKPWYVSDSKWATNHLNVIRELLREEYVPVEKIAYCASYRFLGSEKPDHFGDSDWKELNDLAVNRLKDHISRSIDSYSESSILSVIRLGKPERFPKDGWVTIQTNANEKFIERVKGRLYGKANFVEQLYIEKPEAIPNDTWQTLQNHCRYSYFYKLINEIYSGEELKSVIEKNDLDILDTDQQTKLKEIAQEISKYKDYRAIITSLLREKEIPDEYPGALTDWEWDEIKEFEVLVIQTKDIEAEKQELTRQKIELLNKQSETAREQTTYLQLKDKVVKQLEFINNLLNDPSTIERVEIYDDTFSSGNWKNLKQIAKILNSRKAG